MSARIMNDGIGLTVTEPSAFCPGRRGLGRRLIEYLGHCPELRSARLDLQAGACYFEFAPEARSLSRMAETFVNGIRAAQETERTSSRRDRNWTVLYTRRTNNTPVFLEAEQQGDGYLTVFISAANGPPYSCGALHDKLSTLPGIRKLNTRRGSRGLKIEFDPEKLERDRLLEEIARAWLPTLEAEPRPPLPYASSDFVVHGPRRLLYLAAGCGSFAMVFVGLILPGVPTVPFLLASSYYFARSSPLFHRKLLQSKLFGRMLREWETHRAMSRTSKLRLASFTLAVIAITLAFAPLSPLIVLIVVLMSCLSLYGVARIPQIESQTDKRLEVIG